MPIHTVRLIPGDTLIVVGDDDNPGGVWIVFSITGPATPPDNPSADTANFNYFKGHTLIGRLEGTGGSATFQSDFALPKLIRIGGDMNSLHRTTRGVISKVILNGKPVSEWR